MKDESSTVAAVQMKAVKAIFCGGMLMACLLARGEAVGYRMPPHPLRHLTNAAVRATIQKGRLRSTASASLPSRYDLRDVDGVSHLSPIRDQGSYGTCWTFATMAGLEWLLRRDEGIDADLSENNLANMHGFTATYSQGGNNEMAMAVILREEGPVAEALDPYPRPGVSVRERGVRIPRKVVFVPARTSVLDANQLQADLDAFKQAILTYGPLATSYAHYDTYVNGAAYYCKYALEANHAVSIIGWDDDYPATNFKEAPPGNGAFIVRNSWGTGHFDCGYMYASYYDRTLGFGDVQVAYGALSKGDDYGLVYEHDPYGYVDADGYGQATAAAANVFVARTNETLAAFGFYALQANTSYSASIVLNPALSNGRLSGEWITVKEGVCAFAGYEVVPFDTAVSVTRAQAFAIVVRLSAPGASYPVPVSYNAHYDDGSPYLTNVVAVAGLSFIGSTLNDWEDMSSDGLYFCCKVYPQAPDVAASTTSTETPVPYGWLDRYAAQHGADHLLSYYCGCYNALAEHVAGNGLPVAASFAKGLDPDNAAETNLAATIAFDASGRAVIGVTPENTALWDYTVLGSENLIDWHERAAADRFFKVSVHPKP